MADKKPHTRIEAPSSDAVINTDVREMLAVAMGVNVVPHDDYRASMVVTLNPVKLTNAHPMPQERRDIALAMASRPVEALENRGVTGLHSHVDVEIDTLDDEDSRDQLWTISIDIPADDVAKATELALEYNQHIDLLSQTGHMMQ